jgi:ribosomal protein S27E
MGISEHAAYIKGAFDFSEIDKNSTEGKIIGELLTLVADMADKINALEADNKELHEYVEELDHDLGEVEEELYFYDDDEDFDDYDDLNDDEDYEGEDEEFYEIECPSCGELVYFDESIDLSDLICPACGEKIDEADLCDGNCAECDQDCE